MAELGHIRNLKQQMMKQKLGLLTDNGKNGAKVEVQPSIIVETEYAEELFNLLKEIEKSHEQAYFSYFPQFEMPESYADLGFVPINTTKFLDEKSGIDNLLEKMKESVARGRCSRN